MSCVSQVPDTLSASYSQLPDLMAELLGVLLVHVIVTHLFGEQNLITMKLCLLIAARGGKEHLCLLLALVAACSGEEGSTS